MKKYNVGQLLIGLVASICFAHMAEAFNSPVPDEEKVPAYNFEWRVVNFAPGPISGWVGENVAPSDQSIILPDEFAHLNPLSNIYFDLPSLETGIKLPSMYKFLFTRMGTVNEGYSASGVSTSAYALRGGTFSFTPPATGTFWLDNIWEAKITYKGKLYTFRGAGPWRQCTIYAEDVNKIDADRQGHPKGKNRSEFVEFQVQGNGTELTGVNIYMPSSSSCKNDLVAK